jgi:hypothetical protein
MSILDVFADGRCISHQQAMPEPALLLILHAAATWAATGLIWFVQLVHYPSYRDMAEKGFTGFQTRSTARTGFIVGPLIFIEFGTAAYLLWRPPAGIGTIWLWLGAALIVLNLASTVLIQVPLHVRLRATHDPALVELLIRTNWVRTLAWSIRAALVASWLMPAAQR